MPLLRTRKLVKRFGDNLAVNGVDFAVNDGELIALIGSNGAGKTTLVNLISAYLHPDEGEIIFREQNINEWSPIRRVRSGIARSFQLVSLFDQLTVLENVAVAIFQREGKADRMMSLAKRDHAVQDEAKEALERFGLERIADVRSGAIAHGERKLLDVAVAYALRPSLLFLDEPTSGVNTRDKTQIMDTVASVVRGGKMAAVIVEHDMDVVFKYSDRIVAMHQGAILADGPPEQVRNNNDVVTHMLGGSTVG